jgi:cytochrome c
MKLRLRSLLSAVGCLLLIFFLTGWHGRQGNKVLIFLKNSSNQPAASLAGGTLLSLLQQQGIEADTTSAGAFLAEDRLKQYGLLLLVQTSPDGLDTWQQNDIERFVQAGGSLGLINAGGFTTYQWPWFNDMLAGGDKPADARKPVFWTKPYDGGRVLYAAAATPTSSTFAQQILEGIRQVMEAPALNYREAYTARTPEENRFTSTVLDSYMEEPIEMEIMADNRVLYIERRGAIKLYEPATKSTRVINTLPVHLTGNYEDGLLGLELDPAFETNHFVYLYYSPVGSKPVQNLSRFLFTGDSLQLSSEKVVLQVPVQRETCCHSAGNVYFGPDGLLYLSTGDNTSSKESDGFSPLDERPGRAPFDSQKSSGNTHDLRGKILRIAVKEDGTYALPDGNLFPKDGSAGRPEIYVMGARNPYRITVDKRGYLYWGDVGPDGGVANERGPKSQDEWNQARKPGNYGWPYFVGDNKPYAHFDFATNKVGALYDPARPVNESPNNTGAKVLPPAQKAMIWYPYEKSAEFPMLGTGSRSAMAGPFYYRSDYKKSAVGFPAYYDKKLFIYEWARSWIKVVSFNDAGDLTKIEPFLPTTFISKPIDMKFGPDGAMYVLAYGVNYFARNPDSQLVRIEFSDGNRRPVAKITAATTVGAAPLTARLSGSESFDYDRGDKISYAWVSGNGQQSTAVAPTFTYSKPGVYRVTLTVSDTDGQRSTVEQVIKVGNETPRVDIALRGNRSFYFDKTPLDYTVRVQDKEDGSLSKGIPANKVKFAIDYLAQGKDLALLTTYNPELGDVGAKYVQGKALLTKSDCKSCHALAVKSIGPSLVDVSKRYAPAGENAVPMLARKIINGGNGNWGKNMMSAHPQHTEAETAEMVRYILSLSDDGAHRLPLQGRYMPVAAANTSEEGSYVLSASYTDKGNTITGPLTARKLIILRNPKIQAESYRQSANVDRKHEDGSNQSWVGDIKDGSFIEFPEIDLTGISRLTFNVAALSSRGGFIDIHAGSPTGKRIGTVAVSPLADAGTKNKKGPQWQTVSAPITTLSGTADLYLVFRNDQVKDKNLMLVDWMLFEQK